MVKQNDWFITNGEKSNRLILTKNSKCQFLGWLVMKFVTSGKEMATVWFLPAWLLPKNQKWQFLCRLGEICQRFRGAVILRSSWRVPPPIFHIIWWLLQQGKKISKPGWGKNKKFLKILFEKNFLPPNLILINCLSWILPHSTLPHICPSQQISHQ